MKDTGYQIRRVREDDNFKLIRNLIYDTRKNYYKDDRWGIASADMMREAYISEPHADQETSSKRGFIGEKDGQIIGFMGVTFSETTHNGVIEYGIAEDNPLLMNELLQRCSNEVKGAGGSKLFYFAYTEFGQIRNPELSWMERYGFVSDEFATFNSSFIVRDWDEPTSLDLTHITAEPDIDLEQLRQLLVEDGEEAAAYRFQLLYTENTPDKVIITLRDEEGLIAGFAYYRVYTEPEQQPLANAFGVHIRPRYRQDIDGQMRLIRAALSSMKQLQIEHVITSMSLRHPETLAILVREGFQDFLMNTIRMTKVIG